MATAPACSFPAVGGGAPLVAQAPHGCYLPSVAKIRVLFESGEPERVIEFDPRKAPFQHDGRPGSILDVLLAHGVPLEHACGGNCACTTCHVVVKQGFQQLPPS